jgi:hypothetical protein
MVGSAHPTQAKGDAMSDERHEIELPAVVEEYLAMLTRRIRNRKVRRDVLAELRGHFYEALAEAEDREEAAKELIEDFGDAGTLSTLITRAKKRCRPAWVKFTIRSLQAVAALILILVGYSISFWLAKPNPTVDYVAELNEMVRPRVEESENAAPYYLKAEELWVEPSKALENVWKNPGSTITVEEEKELRSWLTKNEKTFDELSKGVEKPYFWYTYEGEDVISVMFPDLRALRDMARGFCWRIWLMDGGDQQQMLQQLKPVYVMSRHLQTNSASISEQLVGIAIQQMADQQTLLLLQAGKIKLESLPALAEMLATLYSQGYPKFEFRGERITGMDVIQRAFTDGGLGGGHICPKVLGQYRNLVSGDPSFKFLPFDILFLHHPRREETVQVLNDYYDLIDRLKSFPPYIKRNVEGIDPDKFVKENRNNIFLWHFLPALSRAIEMNFRSKAGFQATQTVIALMRYRQSEGRYPESLAELTPRYLKELPRDPYGPGLLVYKKVGEDFTLYSWGVNMEDDGGVHYLRWGEKVKDKAGDYVFWPPVKPE